MHENHDKNTNVENNEINLVKLLDIAVKAALNGASILEDYYSRRNHLRINKKNQNDLVTQADHESELAIIKELKSSKEFCIGLVAEESGFSKIGKATWYIDPLDGTTNFLRGIPHYAISIALVAQKGTKIINNDVLERETPILGVIYDPSRKELFTSALGLGAFLNGKKIICSNNDLDNSIVATGLPSKNYTHKNLQKRLANEIVQQVRSIRKMGSASLDLAWVACGRFDGYWELDLSPWDTAAGTILVRESEGLCDDILQQKPWPSNGWILASNNKIHEKLKTKFIQYINSRDDN